MDLIRKTYAEIDLKAIESNIRKIVNRFIDYKYFFGVVKADSYGMGDIHDAESIIKGGCNYLAVATLEEALQIRKKIKDIPILCFGNIDKTFIYLANSNNITVAINSLEYLNEIKDCNLKNLKVHIKINSGMNRLRDFKC